MRQRNSLCLCLNRRTVHQCPWQINTLASLICIIPQRDGEFHMSAVPTVWWDTSLESLEKDFSDLISIFISRHGGKQRISPAILYVGLSQSDESLKRRDRGLLKRTGFSGCLGTHACIIDSCRNFLAAILYCKLCSCPLCSVPICYLCLSMCVCLSFPCSYPISIESPATINTKDNFLLK